jgi:hypothetical protein
MDQFSHDPGAFGSFDEPSAQRGGSRDSLLLSAQLRLASAAPVTVRVRNLSPGGLMAEFSGRVTLEQPVDIEVRGIGWIEGRIAWVAEGRVGIAFDTPIDPLLARKPVVVPSRAPAPKRGRALL